MIKRLESWLKGLFRHELDLTETIAGKELNRLEAKFSSLHLAATRDLQEFTEEIKAHTTKELERLIADLREKISADAKAIAEYRKSVRLSCSLCGRLSWFYSIEREFGKVVCSVCKEKGKS